MKSTDENSKRKRYKSPSDDARRFKCDFPKCQKYFSRSDHLSRHKLNHAPTQIYRCKRCPKQFVRADLLARHENRHDRREAEEAAAATANPDPVADPLTHPLPQTQLQQLPVELYSAPGLSISTPSSSPYHTSPLAVSHPHETSLPPLPNHFPRLSPFRSSVPLNQDPPSVSHDEYTAPPYSYDPTPSADSSSSHRHNSQHSQGSPHDFPSFNPTRASPSLFSHHSPSLPNGSVDSFLVNDTPTSAVNPELVITDQSGHYGVGLEPSFFTAQDYMWLFDDDDLQGKDFPSNSHSLSATPGNPSAASDRLKSLSKPSSPAGDNNNHDNNNSFSFDQSQFATDSCLSELNGGNTTNVPSNQSFQNVQSRITKSPALDRSVRLDSETRHRILRHFGMRHLALNSHFTVPTLQKYLELYWTRFAEVQYSILHRPTFVASKAPTPLLCAMICIGAYFSTDGISDIIDAAHTTLRGNLICSPDFKPRAELWIIQTSLLVILYGKLCGKRALHEMAHVLWGSCVTLYRRAALFTPRFYHINETKLDDIEAHWHAWVLEESAKRAAFAAFETDITHYALFRHTPTLSSFHMQLTLEADEDEWNAPNASRWHELHIVAPPRPQFLSALKSSLVSDIEGLELSACGRVSVLHGLMSVAFDLQRRDHFVNGINSPDDFSKDWKSTISAAYNRWKSHLDTALVSATYPSNAILRNSIPLYALAHMTISVDIHEMQIQAGANVALGLTVPEPVIERAENKINAWRQSKEGRASVWHAAHFLRSCIVHHYQIPDDLSRSIHIYVKYLACVLLYCFSGGDQNGVRSEGFNLSAMEFLDALCTDSPDTIDTDLVHHKAGGLLAEVFKLISDAKWDIAAEGADILIRLLQPSKTATRPTPTHQMISSGV